MRTSTSTSGANSPGQKPRARPALDAGVLAQILGFRPAVRQRVLGLYLKDAPAAVAGLRASLDRNDPRSVREGAHRLKSSSATLGATLLAALCHELERAGESGDLAGAGSLLARLGAELELVAAELSNLVEPFAEAG